VATTWCTGGGAVVDVVVVDDVVDVVVVGGAVVVAAARYSPAPAATAVPEPPSRLGNSAGRSATVTTMLQINQARRSVLDKGPYS
jgi:hypothetical protein